MTKILCVHIMLSALYSHLEPDVQSEVFTPSPQVNTGGVLTMCKNNRRTYILSHFHCPKDEMEELRSEMLEMRDMYMEEDVYQLQELRQQLEQVCGYKDRLV